MSSLSVEDTYRSTQTSLLKFLLVLGDTVVVGGVVLVLVISLTCVMFSDAAETSSVVVHARYLADGRVLYYS